MNTHVESDDRGSKVQELRSSSGAVTVEDAQRRATSSDGPDPYPGGLSEVTVVCRVQDGDVSAFEMLLSRYQRPIFRLAYRMLTDRGDAEEVVQDCFIAVWRKLPSLTDPIAFQRWIYQIATRRCLTILRARTRHKTDVTDTTDLEPDRQTTVWDDPALAAEHGAQIQRLHHLLQQLPDEQRACWILKELHELTYPEIAYAMQLPASTVRGRIARARQNLAKGMSSWR